MANLLAVTAPPDGLGCSLTAFSEAYRQGKEYPDLSGGELAAVKPWVKPVLDALINEALARSGGTREDLRREQRRGVGLPRR